MKASKPFRSFSVRALLCCLFIFGAQAFAEVQSHLTMSVPNLIVGNSGTYSATAVTGAAGTSSGTDYYSYAGVHELTQTSSTGRFAPYDGVSRFGVIFDTFLLFQSFIDANYFTVLNSGTACPSSGTYNWMMARWRTPDAPRLEMNATDTTTTAGGVFSYSSSTSTFTGTKSFNLVGPTLNSSPTYGVTGYSGATCSSGYNLGQSTGSSSIDPYLYVYYGTNDVVFVAAGGNPQVIIATPQQTLTGNMTPLSNYVLTGLFTYFSSKTTQTQNNVYLYPDVNGTTYTIRQVTSLTDPTQYTTLGTLACTSLDSPTTGFCSGTLTLSGVSGTGKAVCLVTQATSQNQMMCSAEYPSKPSYAVTIIAQTVNQAVLQVSVPTTAASVTSVGQNMSVTATVQNLSSRYASSIGNPTISGDQLASPWSDTGAFGGGSGTCGTSLAAYASCTYPVQYTSTAIGTQTTTLRVLYNNGVSTPYATSNLVGVTGLTSLAVTPASTNENNGTTTQLTATATYSDGSTQNVTSAVNWSSSNITVGTVSTAGLATWLTTGSATMTASLASTTNSATYTIVNPVVLTSVSNQNFRSSYLAQGSTFTQDFNNISGGAPGNDTNMVYACAYDQTVDGVVSPGTSCTSLPGTASFNTATGVFSWTPNTAAWGPYEIKITGTYNGTSTGTEIFVIDVRPGYTLTNLRGDYQGQFANLTSNYTSANYDWLDLTTNAFNGVLSSTINASWVGNGAYNSPYALSLNGLANIDFGSSIMASQTKMMFSAWINPSSSNAVDEVILGDNNDGAGNGFTLRQAKTSNGHLEFSVGLEGTYTATITSGTPTAYYRLDETAGPTLFDSSGNTYNLVVGGSGTTYGVTGAITGDTDTAIQFGGTGYACNTTTNSLTGTYTVEAWVNPATATGTLGVVGSRSPSDYSFELTYQAGKFHGQIGNGTSWLTTTADTAASYTTLNAWYHVVYVITPTTYTIYVDGTSAGSGSYSSSTPILFNSTHNLCVGANGSGVNDFNGKIDEVAVYSYGLTSTTVLTHYNLGRSYFTTVVGDLPTAYWRLGESSGTTLYDSTASGYNLTINGSGQTLDQPGAISGDTNGALQLSGSAYPCFAPGSNSLTGTFSVEAWVYPTSSATFFGIVGSRNPSDSSFDMKYQSGKFHGDVGNGSSWLSTTVDTATAYTTLNTWYHVVYVVTPTGYTIYVNGANAGSGSWSTSTPDLFDSTHELCVGADGTGFEEFIGKLDEVAIYNYALTATQVTNHYNSGIGSYVSTSCPSVSTLTSNVWNHVSGLFDGTNATLFINGRSECTMIPTGTLSSPTTDLIGGSTGIGTKYWSGLIAGMQMYGATGATSVGTAANINTNFSTTADQFRATPVGNIVTNGLVLHYDAANATRGLTFPGTGITQTSFFDLSSSILDGTLNNFTGSGTSGWIGAGTPTSPYALAFDGVAANVSTNYTETSVTGYTIDVWMKTTDAGTKRTFVNDRGAAGSGQSLTLGIGTTGGGHGGAGLVGWELDSNSIDIGVSSTTAVNDGTWHHVVGTWAAASGTAIAPSQFIIYIDDQAASLTTSTTGTAPTSPLTGSGPTEIGYSAAWGTYWTGSLARVAIYNRALSSAEVTQNCKAIVSRFSGAACH